MAVSVGECDMYSCPLCGSKSIDISYDATAVYGQDETSILTLVDTLTYDVVEKIACRTCNYSQYGKEIVLSEWTW